MCGICVVLLKKSLDSNNSNNEKVQDYIRESRLSCRGPDVQNTCEISITSDVTGLFYGSTLHFRGCLTKQPLQDDLGNLLVWNGEIFDGLKVDANENDGAVLLNLLRNCRSEEEILQIFVKIKGPWAFVYLQAENNRLWFGRDVFGRRSLMCHTDTEQNFVLASIAVKPWTPWKEVPAVGIYCAHLESKQAMCQNGMNPIEKVLLYPWAEPVSYCSQPVLEAVGTNVFNKTLMSAGCLIDIVVVEEGSYKIHPPIGPFNSTIAETRENIPNLDTVPSFKTLNELADDSTRALANQLIEMLEAAVLVRTTCQSHKCSDCIQTVLASRKDDKLFSNTNDDDQDKLNAQLNSVCTVEKTAATNCDKSETHVGLNSANDLIRDHTDIVRHKELSPIPDGAGNQDINTIGCGHSRVAVLFSGGVDSLIIAALADRCVPKDDPIDLLNVAFEQHKKIDAGKGQAKGKQKLSTCTNDHINSPDYDVPDRQTGREGLLQLQNLNPNRQYNFVEINVTIEKLKEARLQHVKDLVYPLSTVLDDSIGCAIWFASRGQGIMTNKSGVSTSYTSLARIVLVGMGADEQFAGYSRHRVKFNTEGWSGLVKEIQMEIERISSRNLGRDDRVISDHGRESRFPFLDENVVSFLNTLPLNNKTNLHLPRGIGEKFLLRLAAESIGLTKGAMAPKRAIQFGSRIAKAESRKEKGSDACERLKD